MRLPVIAITTFLLTERSSAFSPACNGGALLSLNRPHQQHHHHHQQQHRRRQQPNDHDLSSVRLHQSSEPTPPEKKKLTAADILARARKSVNDSSGKTVVEEDDPADEERRPDYPFDDDLLEDMKNCLLTLEKRVKEGPGSLTAGEVRDLADASARLARDMNENTVVAVAPPPAVGEAFETAVVPPDNFNEDLAAVHGSAVRKDTIPVAAATNFHETSDEEGAAYAGKGGLGLATGTRNTYLIPGMDEMSPEEYRAALQESVSNRQKQRREKRDGLVGNKSALQYLDQLGYGGASDNYRVTDDGGESKFAKIDQNPPAVEYVPPPPPPPPPTPTPPSPQMSVTVSDPVVPLDNFNEDTAVVTPYDSATALADTITSASAPAPGIPTAAATNFHETSDEEGAAYAGKGGLGLASGTRNTYLIPGMDEMSPEEYRAALQESVSQRQKQRREKRDGLVGNKSALQYLDQLGYGGASDNYKVTE